MTTKPWLLALALGAMATLPLISSCNAPSPQLLLPGRCASFIHSTHRHAGSMRVMSTPSSSRMAMSSSPLSSSSSSSSKSASNSPWSPGTWRVTLDFGREGSDSSEAYDNSLLSDALGEEWGAGGGRLVLSLEVLANAETSKQEDANSIQMRWLGGKPTGTVECTTQTAYNGEEYCAQYVNKEGEQNVKILPGQWRIEPPLPLLPTYANILPGQASTLRYYLTLLTSVERNSISFPENQLLLLQSNAFRTDQYADGIQTLLPYQYAKETSQRQLEEQLNHETGDRRLDGSDLLETLEGYKDAAALVLERDERRRKWKEIEGALPRMSASVGTGRRVDINNLLEDEDKWGVWPGDTELMTIERGVILAVASKASSQSIFPWMHKSSGSDEQVVVGKWTATPVFDDEDDIY